MKEGGSSASSCGYFFRKVDTCTSLKDKSGLWLSGKRNCFPAVWKDFALSKRQDVKMDLSPARFLLAELEVSSKACLDLRSPSDSNLSAPAPFTLQKLGMWLQLNWMMRGNIVTSSSLCEGSCSCLLVLQQTTGLASALCLVFWIYLGFF